MERRQNVPHIRRKADEVLADLRTGQSGSGRLDAIGTMTELEPDDLVALVLELGRCVIDAEE